LPRYCSFQGGLSLANDAENAVKSAQNTQITCSGSDVCTNDIVEDILDEVNDLLGDLENIVFSWPEIPPNLAAAIDLGLAQTGLQSALNQLKNFSAVLITFNATQIIDGALGNSIDFYQVNATCNEVAVKFQVATNETALIMYYVEIAVWLAIALLIVGIFIVSIVRQFPTAVMKKISDKWDDLTERMADRFHRMEEDSSGSKSKQYMIWMMKYINFKLAIMTTLYGALGLIMVYSLSTFTQLAQTQVDIWIDDAMAPGMAVIADKVQGGINSVLNDIQNTLNSEIQSVTQSQIDALNSTVVDIQNLQAYYWGDVDLVLDSMNDVPVIGPVIASALTCWLPLNATNLIIDSVETMMNFMVDILSIRISIPRYTFPTRLITDTATSVTHVCINYVVGGVQSEMYKYQIVFIFLCIAFGILVFQGLIFIAMKKAIDKLQERRRTVPDFTKPEPTAPTQ